MPSEAVSLNWLAATQEEVSASLHEGTVEISRLDTALSHLRGEAEEKWQETDRNKCLHFIMNIVSDGGLIQKAISLLRKAIVTKSPRFNNH